MDDLSTLPINAPLNETEWADIRKRRAAAKASLACEGMYLTAEQEAVLDQLHAERLTSDEGAARIVARYRAKQRAKEGKIK